MEIDSDAAGDEPMSVRGLDLGWTGDPDLNRMHPSVQRLDQFVGSCMRAERFVMAITGELPARCCARSTEMENGRPL